MNSDIIEFINKKVEYSKETAVIDVEAAASNKTNDPLSLSVYMYMDENNENMLSVVVDDYCFKEAGKNLSDPEKAECLFSTIESCLSEIPNPVLYENAINVFIYVDNQEDESIIKDYLEQHIYTLFEDVSHISVMQKSFVDDTDPNNLQNVLLLTLHCHFERHSEKSEHWFS